MSLFWTPEALALCKEHSLAIAPHFRSTYTTNSFLRGLRRARTRHRLKRELDRMGGATLDLDAE